MEEQKKAARAAWSGSGDAGTEKLWFEILDRVGPTEFLGYKTETSEGQVLAIVKDGKEVNALKKGEEGSIVTNQTPFYAESGGQVGDTGIFKAESASADVTDTKKVLGQLFVHQIKVSSGEIQKGESVEMQVDHNRRSAIRSNHSVTHLLHEALRQRLGDHVAQKVLFRMINVRVLIFHNRRQLMPKL